jgi:hypothetical protein
MADGRDDPERSAAEGGVHLRHEFLEGILLGAGRAAEIAAEAGRMAAGVRLMPISA